MTYTAGIIAEGGILNEKKLCTDIGCDYSSYDYYCKFSKDIKKEKKFGNTMKTICLRFTTVLSLILIAVIAIPFCIFTFAVYLVWNLADNIMSAIEHTGKQKRNGGAI